MCVNDWQFDLWINHVCKAMAQQNKIACYFRTACRFPSILVLANPIFRDLSTPQQPYTSEGMCVYTYVLIHSHFSCLYTQCRWLYDWLILISTCQTKEGMEWSFLKSPTSLEDGCTHFLLKWHSQMVSTYFNPLI